MATLRLKKPAPTSAPIDRRPLTNLDSLFAVMRQSANSKAMRFTCIHETIEAASDEARRLVIKVPGSRFLVLQVIASFEG